MRTESMPVLARLTSEVPTRVGAFLHGRFHSVCQPGPDTRAADPRLGDSSDICRHPALDREREGLSRNAGMGLGSGILFEGRNSEVRNWVTSA